MAVRRAIVQYCILSTAAFSIVVILIHNKGKYCQVFSLLYLIVLPYTTVGVLTSHACAAPNLTLMPACACMRSSQWVPGMPSSWGLPSGGLPLEHHRCAGSPCWCGHVWVLITTSEPEAAK